MQKKICSLCLLLLFCAGTACADTFSATTAGQHAISLTTNSSKTYTNAEVTKTGDATGSSDGTTGYDWTGSNAAVFASGKAKLTISGSDTTIESNAVGGNAVFSYGGNLNGSNSGDGTTITISDAEITTTKNNSGGIMVTGGGKITASNLTITTSGGSSAAIRSDKGGGTISVTGGTYSTTGQGSPAIYSTAKITGEDVTLKSNASQVVVIEGGNSVTLTDSELTANHSTLNGQDTTYQAVLIYQSQSGDASNGASYFTMTGGSITNTKGDVFCVTNTTTTITLSGVEITNDDSSGYFLRAEAQNWGSSGSNGGKVTLKATNQEIDGNILIDSASTLTLNLSGSSEFNGAINPSSQSGTVKVTVASGSTWTLTSDSYITSISNSGTIDQGDYTLYVNGTAYDGSASINVDNTGTTPTITTETLKDATATKSYSATLKASGTTPITWTADSLPDGLSLNSSTGKLSGKPTESGEYSITFTATNAAGSDTTTLDLTVKDVAPKIKGSVKAGVKDTAYSTTFSTTAGTGDITWELEGNLPDGLSFDQDSATLGGIPTEVWNDYITIKATNTIETTKKYKLVIKAVKPKFTTKTLASGVAGDEYSASIDITGSKTITVKVEGLPDGLTSEFDSETGEISIAGTLETAGKYSVKIEATNDAGTTKKTFKLIVNSAPDITTTPLDDGTTGKSYSKKLVAKGTTPITWALDSGSSLPAGLTLTSKGQIKGKPTSFGSTTFTVTATNAYGTDTADVTININSVAPVITPKSLKKGTAGSAYSVELKAKKGTAPITWECEGDLPDGIAFSDGVFSGTPTSAFSGTVKVTATNAAGESTEMTYNLVIKAVAPKISTTSLASGTVGTYYSAELATSAGTEPITWSWTNEPSDLDLDSETGEIYGTPTTAGKYRVKVTATNDLKSVSKTLTLNVAAAASGSSVASSLGGIESEVAGPSEPEYPVSGLSLPEGYEIVYELGEIGVDESGMYDMALELEDNAKSGAKLFWLARATSREPSEDDTIAEFFAPDGEEIREVPSDKKIIVSAWLEAGVKYNPVIAVK